MRSIFSPAADVSPSILVVKKAEVKEPEAESYVCVIPRDSVPEVGLSEAVAAHSFALRQSFLQSGSWTLERPEILALIDKVKSAGEPLASYEGSAPLYGVKTGFNEAFLIDTETRDRLISEDASAQNIIKPYIRGQDINRWWTEDTGLWMIFARRGIDISDYPSVQKHLGLYREKLEPKPENWKPTANQPEWNGRKTGSYRWYELQDAVDYYEKFATPKILVKRIAFHSRFAMDAHGYFINDSCLAIPTIDPWIISVLSSPIAWYLMFKMFPHKKDEALSLDIDYLAKFPVPPKDKLSSKSMNKVSVCIENLASLTGKVRQYETAFAEWLRLTFDFDKLPTKLDRLSEKNERDALVAILATFPQRRQPGAVELVPHPQRTQGHDLASPPGLASNPIPRT